MDNGSDNQPLQRQPGQDSDAGRQKQLDKLRAEAQVDPSETLPVATQQLLESEDDKAGLPPSPELPAIDVHLPNAAEDTDLIEKEWIKKIHDIINETQGDPFKRQQMIAQVKKEYLKKRYNHVIGSDINETPAQLNEKDNG